MLTVGLVEVFLGINAESRSLDSITEPLTAVGVISDAAGAA
jgi:hypothetical protein